MWNLRSKYENTEKEDFKSVVEVQIEIFGFVGDNSSYEEGNNKGSEYKIKLEKLREQRIIWK